MAEQYVWVNDTLYVDTFIALNMESTEQVVHVTLTFKEMGQNDAEPFSIYMPFYTLTETAEGFIPYLSDLSLLVFILSGACCTSLMEIICKAGCYFYWYIL